MAWFVDKKQNQTRTSTASVWKKAYFYGLVFCVVAQFGFLIRHLIVMYPNESVGLLVCFTVFYLAFIGIGIWTAVAMYNDIWKVKKEDEKNDG